MKHIHTITAIAVIILFTVTSCGTGRKAAKNPVTGYEAAGTVSQKETDKLHKRFKPLQRPQVRFNIEKSVLSGDSCWVAVRMAVPYKSVQRREIYSAQFILNTADAYMELGELTFDARHRAPHEKEESGEESTVDITTRAGHLCYLYYSVKFAYDERMGQCTDITIWPSVANKRYAFYYMPVTLPLYRQDSSTCGELWKQVSALPQAILLETLPTDD